MAQVRIDFQRRGEVETFSRARVQAMHDGVQLALGVAQQVRLLGEVLAHQAIGVLVGAALPGAVRIGKEDLDLEPLGQALVLGPPLCPRSYVTSALSPTGAGPMRARELSS